MKKLFITTFAFMLCAVGIVLMGCGETKYDLTSVTVEDQSVNYTGSAIVLTDENVSGELPSGVQVSFAYFEDEAHETSTTPINAGSYFGVATFYVDLSKEGSETSNIKKLETRDFVLTVNKVLFTDVEFTVVGQYSYTDDDENNVTETVYSSYNEEDNVYEIQYVDEQTLSLSLSDNVDGENVLRATYYYNASSEEEISESTQTLDPNLSTVGSTLFVVRVLSDENHLETTVTLKVMLTSKVIEISSVEDLEQIYVDIYEKTSFTRANYTYRLMNDIDMTEKTWKVISPFYAGTDRGNNSGTYYFCSEFDGNGYSIKNVSISNASLTYTVTLSDENVVTVDGRLSGDAVHVGLFGYVYEGSIHDLTVDTISIDLDMDANVKACTEANMDVVRYICYVGGIYARSEHESSTVLTETYNITVKDATYNIVAYKAYIGGIIGAEGTTASSGTDTTVYTHENLNVENMTINWSKGNLNTGDGLSISSVDEKVFIGGLVGMSRNKHINEWKDCSVDGLAVTLIGYTSNAKNESMLTTTTDNVYFGGFMGYNRAHDKLTNCTISNATSRVMVGSDTLGVYLADYCGASEVEEIVITGCSGTVDITLLIDDMDGYYTSSDNTFSGSASAIKEDATGSKTKYAYVSLETDDEEEEL